MEKKYIIRPIKVEDFTDLIKWWEHYEHVEVPESHLLPNHGLGGLVVEKEGKVLIASFMYLTNSSMGYLDHLISDPDYKGKDKYQMIWDLQEACTKSLLRQGCKMIWAMTSYNGLAQMAEKQGHDVLDEKYHIIYTHHSVHDKLIKQEENGKK